MWAFKHTKLSNVLLYPGIEFLDEHAFDRECELTLIGGIEYSQLSAWLVRRDCDHKKPREDHRSPDGDW